MGYSDSADLPGLPEPPEWFSPWSYPSRVDDALAIRIATNVALGSTIASAAMAEGVAPSRASMWLKWGADAYDRDAGAKDKDGAYLNFFLKIMQATGISAVTLQQELRRQNPTWWLSHHPEVRAEWGGDPYQARIEPVARDVEEANVVEASTAPVADTERLRNVLKMLLEGGALTAGGEIPSTATVPYPQLPGTVEADADAPSAPRIVDADERKEDAG